MPSKKDRRAYYKAYREDQKKHSHRVSVRFTPEEYKHFEQEAKARNISIKTLTQEYVLTSLSMPPLDPTPLKNDLQDLTRLIKPLADNINRMARETNMNRQLKDENELLLEIKSLDDTVRGFIQQKTDHQP